jgi:hypothetical protein
MMSETAAGSGERVACPLVDRERVGPPSAPVQGEHELRLDLLVKRDERL